MKAKLWWLVEDRIYKREMEELQIVAGPYFRYLDAADAKVSINEPVEIVEQVVEMEEG